MEFKKIQLNGFKSFADKTNFLIEEGLTGIVGPNGCGKSNIVEALRWVMGETSAKSMRGSGMEDVIFSGTSNKASKNIAEVSIDVENKDNEGPIQYREIDQINILEATKLSMTRVLDKLNLSKANLIIDGNFKLNYKNYSELSVIKGDQLSISIATASIIAKIHRDRLMKILSKKFTKFTWDINAGYGTKQHMKELNENGPTIYHRKSFEPIKSLIHNK